VAKEALTSVVVNLLSEWELGVVDWIWVKVWSTAGVMEVAWSVIAVVLRGRWEHGVGWMLSLNAVRVLLRKVNWMFLLQLVVTAVSVTSWLLNLIIHVLVVVNGWVSDLFLVSGMSIDWLLIHDSHFMLDWAVHVSMSFNKAWSVVRWDEAELRVRRVRVSIWEMSEVHVWVVVASKGVRNWEVVGSSIKISSKSFMLRIVLRAWWGLRDWLSWGWSRSSWGSSRSWLSSSLWSDSGWLWLG
jgi:hypothetical protein